MSDVTNCLHATDLALTLYENSLLNKNTDFTLVVGETEICCHSAVVCALSPYLDGLYDNGSREANLDEYVSPQDGAVLPEIVRHFYLGTIDLRKDTVVAVSKVSHCIQYDKLVEECTKFMLGTLSVETYHDYSVAAAKLKLQELDLACKVFSRKNFSSLLSTECFLPSLSVSELVDYFKDDDVYVDSEDEVLEALWKWLDSHKGKDKKKEEDLEKLVPHVRLSFCDAEKLAALQKDKKVPAILRLKLAEFQNNPRESETKRTSYADPPEVPTEPQAPVEDHSPRFVMVGGRETGNKSSDQITYLDEDHKYQRLTHAELCNDSGFFSVCFHDDNITISGGFSNCRQESIRDVHQFNTRTRRWTTLADMPDARSRHVSVILHAHLLFIIAGCLEKPFGECKRWYKKVHALDLRTGKWQTVCRMPYAVINASAAVVNGLILVTSGADVEKRGSQTTIKYDESRDVWSLCASIPAARTSSWSSTVSVGNHLYVLAHRDFLMYDITTDEWTILEAPPKPSYYTAMLLHDDALVAVGGYERTVNKPHGRLQRYEIKAKKWTLVEEITTTPFSFRYACCMPLH